MNADAVLFCLPSTVRRLVPQVFGTMLRLSAKSLPVGAPEMGERISATIGIAGPSVTGSLFIHFPLALAYRSAKAMLGAAETPDNATVNDVASELANMIGGGIKSALNDAAWHCAMSTPSVIRGVAFTVELPPGTSSETFFFDCMGDTLAVEIQLKLD